jgi:hypothetical protein
MRERLARSSSSQYLRSVLVTRGNNRCDGHSLLWYTLCMTVSFRHRCCWINSTPALNVHAHDLQLDPELGLENVGTALTFLVSRALWLVSSISVPSSTTSFSEHPVSVDPTLVFVIDCCVQIERSVPNELGIVSSAGDLYSIFPILVWSKNSHRAKTDSRFAQMLFRSGLQGRELRSPLFFYPL